MKTFWYYVYQFSFRNRFDEKKSVTAATLVASETTHFPFNQAVENAVKVEGMKYWKSDEWILNAEQIDGVLILNQVEIDIEEFKQNQKNTEKE